MSHSAGLAVGLTLEGAAGNLAAASWLTYGILVGGLCTMPTTKSLFTEHVIYGHGVHIHRLQHQLKWHSAKLRPLLPWLVK